MSKIRVLSTNLASQIAAGEVVERPASVVKELLENAVDAGATRCTVEVDGGGIQRLTVSDDGCGMSPEDARLCLERHATSKIARFEDLSSVASYGFRGEALPSIAAVSRLRLSTRTSDAEEGVEVRVEGNAPPVVTPAGRAVGTTVDVVDLFYNVPARRKFLRSSGTEAGHVTEVVETCALGRPELGVTLLRDGRKVREFLRSPDTAARVQEVYAGEQFAQCEGQRGPLGVEAYLSRPERARTGAAGLYLYVNRRPVKDRMLAATAAHAYGSVLERGRYPRGVVYLTLPLTLVDVNVHPQKAEVRFADPRAVSDALYAILSRALSSAFSLPHTPVHARAAAASPAATWIRPPPAALDDFAAAESTTKDSATRPSLALYPAAPIPAPEPAPGPDSSASADAALLAIRDSAAAPIRPRPAVRWSNLRFVAQLRQTYLVCEDDEGLYVLDQHAAAERVNFDRLRKQYRARAVTAQSLLFPVTFTVSQSEVELVERYSEQIASVGLDVRVRGAEALSVHAVPGLLQRASPERLVHDLLSELSRSGGRGFSDAVDLTLATMACHGSIRSGDHVSADAAGALLRALDQADFAGHCPHGRPVVTYTSWSELERKVGRR
ncbi:MAG: DNA mismatch repair endonuclease MutL [Polyangiaceae bacterium]|nr:DNA mismatch repair endonuclease MutL [Polyangiaceae bacterium]